MDEANVSKLEFGWCERQFHVPNHVVTKVASGASRNLVVRGVVGRVTADEIREQLDHIYNLVLVDVSFVNGDALVSTNSIDNALFSGTCMMSRSTYKGVKIDWALDECAAPLPQTRPKPRTPPTVALRRPTPTMNHYALLDTDSNLDSESESDEGLYTTDGIPIDSSWTSTVVA